MAARTDFEPNVAPDPNPDVYTTHSSDDGIAGQLLYPVSGVNAYRAAEFAAGHVSTLEVGDEETWPPVYEE